MDSFTGPARWLVPDELEQVMRLARFRQAHPGVMVGAGRGWWQAVIPATNGEQVITRYTLQLPHWLPNEEPANRTGT